MSEHNDDFAVGDVVYLKSGGAGMTITAMNPNLLAEVAYNKAGEIRWATLPIKVLTKQRPATEYKPEKKNDE